jgi:hypothetical protein
MLQMKKHTTAKIAALIASLATMAAAFGLVQYGTAGSASADAATQAAPVAGASQANVAPAKSAAPTKTKSAQPSVRVTTRTHVS